MGSFYHNNIRPSIQLKESNTKQHHHVLLGKKGKKHWWTMGTGWFHWLPIPTDIQKTVFFFAKKKLLNPETCKFIALVTEGFISEDLYFIVETRTKKKEKETPNEMPLLNQGESVFMSY